MSEKMGMEGNTSARIQEKVPTGIEKLRARIEALKTESRNSLQVQVRTQEESEKGSPIWQDSAVYGPTVSKDGPSRDPIFQTDSEGDIQMVCSFANAQGKTETFVSTDDSGTRFKNEETGREVEVHFVL